MRRTFAMLGVLSGLGAGLGCQHIGGKHDCQAHPSDAVIAEPTAPYASIPVAALPSATTIPPADNNGKDKAKPEAKPETKPKLEQSLDVEINDPMFKPSAGIN